MTPSVDRECLRESTVIAFVTRALPGGPRARVEAHMAVCAECRELVSEIALVELPGVEDASRVAPPSPRWARRVWWTGGLAVALLAIAVLAGGRHAPATLSVEIADRTGYADRAWMPIAVAERLRATLAASGAQVVPARRLRESTDHARVIGALSSRADGRVRLTLAAFAHESIDESIDAIIEEGAPDELTALTLRAAERLQRALSLAPPDEPGVGSGARRLRAHLPAGDAALRWYAEGVALAEAHDPLAARALLERAVAASPRFAPAQLALSMVWETLGERPRAAAALRSALAQLPDASLDEALALTAHLRELEQAWPRAQALYRRLLARRPTDLQVGALLADAERAAGDPARALATLARLARTVERPGDPPLLELAEARAALAAHDPVRAQKASRAALRRARTLELLELASAARRLECAALALLGDGAAALEAADDARALASAAGDRAGEADALIARGTLLAATGALARARSALAEAAQLADAAGEVARARAAREESAALPPTPV